MIESIKADKGIWLAAGSFTLVLLLVGLFWGARDANIVVAYWGSALGTALGGMVAVVAALTIWNRQRKQAVQLGKRERSLRAGREVYARISEIRSIASTGALEPLGAISTASLELIRQQRVAAIPEIAGVEDEGLREYLENAMRYVTTTQEELEALDAVAPFVLRAVIVAQAVSEALADFRDEKPRPFAPVKSSDDYDEVLKGVFEKKEQRRIELWTKLARYGLSPEGSR